MNRILISFAAGALVNAIAVFWVGGQLAGMVILGAGLTILALIALARLITLRRLTRWLLRLQNGPDSIQDNPRLVRRPRAGRDKSAAAYAFLAIRNEERKIKRTEPRMSAPARGDVSGEAFF